MRDNINPEMVRLARESRGMTQEELAVAAGLRQGTISKLEIGDKEVSTDALQSIAEALAYPPSFFYQEDRYTGLGISTIFYRKKASTLVSHTRRLQAEVNICRMHAVALLRDAALRTPFSIQFLDIDAHTHTPEDIAAMVRGSWKLPSGPVRNLTTAIENAGGFVFKFPFGTTDIDAISQWPDDGPPLFFLNAQAPADRIRFSLSHELGHVVMHNSASPTMEDEANAFAGEFLMPAKEIREHLMDMTLAKAAGLKPHWRVSMKAILYRSHKLQCMSDFRFRNLMISYSQMGYGREEPYAISSEDPKLVPALVQAHMQQTGLTAVDMARMLHLTEGEFTSRYARTATMKIAG